MGKSFQFKNCGNGREQSMKKVIFILIMTFCCTCFFVGPSLSNEKNILEPVTIRASISAPTLTVTTVDTKVSFSWTSVSGATGYTLYYAPYPGVTSIGSIDMGNQTSFSANLSEGNAFYVAIQAYNNNESSVYSNICYFILTSPQRQLHLPISDNYTYPFR